MGPLMLTNPYTPRQAPHQLDGRAAEHEAIRAKRLAFSMGGLVAVVTAAVSLPASVSAAPGGVPGNKPSFSPDVSANGRFVVFGSDATNLVPGDTNGRRDVFVRDTQNRTTRLVSKGLNGRQSNGASYFTNISDDGRFVSFVSRASNLVLGDTNGKDDVFRADLSTGKIIRVSVGAGGVQANGASEGARMSANGNSIVFGSAASNLIRGDTNGVNDVFLRDISTGVTRRLSTTSQGNQNLASSRAAAISPNGSIATWVGPVGFHDAVYRWDRGTNKVTISAEPSEGVGTLRVSNGGPAWAEADTDGYNYYYSIRVYNQPATSAFIVEYSNNTMLNEFDVSLWGNMVAFANPDTYRVEVRDKTTSDLSSDEPLAAVGSAEWRGIAFSSDGNKVVGVDTAGQIKLWSWRTNAVTIVSVN